MALIITYDIPRKYHRQLEKLMGELGYCKRFPVEVLGQYYPNMLALPSNCLYHEECDTKRAVQDLEKICGFMGFPLKRAVAIRLESHTTFYVQQDFDREKWLERILPKGPEG